MNSSELIKRITLNPDVCFGKPTIRNLRYSVEWMIDLLGSGMTNDEILADYEDLEKDDILACLVYAGLVLQTKSIYIAS
ncbi:MAG: DUF433 domain-containing protein [Leptospiraceae bacterium]|nr:DUF433 domain-containing protein [Leptospiraceae bacterium]